MELSQYKTLIEALINSSLPDENLHSNEIVRQLESFLNTRFDKSIKHDLKKIAHKSISDCRKIEIEREQLYKNAKEVQEKSIQSLIAPKLKTRAWLNSLYLQNVDPEHQEEIINEGIEEEAVDYSMPPETTQTKLTSIWRENISLMYRLNHSLNPYSFAPTREKFKERRQINYKRRQASLRSNYKSNNESCLTDYTSITTPLFTWSINMQNLLNIEAPLSTKEVVSLVFKYINKHKLMKDSRFYCDDKTEFISHTPCSSKIVFQHIIANKIDKVGRISRDGVRTFNDGTIIPITEYNINEEPVIQPTNLSSSFSTIFKSKSHR